MKSKLHSTPLTSLAANSEKLNPCQKKGTMKTHAWKILTGNLIAKKLLMTCLAILLSSVLPAAYADTPIAIVVTNGTPAPDGNGTIDIHYSYVPGIFPVVINDAGQVAFGAYLDNTLGGSNNSAIYLGDAFGRLTTIVHQGQPAPDGNGTFSYINGASGSSVYPPTLNSNGEVAFFGKLVGTIGGTNNYGLFRASAGLVTQIVRSDWAVPDNNGTYKGSSFTLSPALNSSGQVAFYSTLNGATLSNSGHPTDAGIFLGTGGDRTTIAQIFRKGYSYPPYGTFNGSLSSVPPALNDLGQIAFEAAYGGFSPSNYLFRADGATLTPIASGTSPAPDGNGTLYGADVSEVTLNNSGQVAFLDYVQNTIGGTNAWGLFRGDGNTLTQIVRSGQPVPDGNGRFGDNFTPPNLEAVNNLGQIVFSTYIAGTTGGTNATGIYLYDGGTITKIARAGDIAPDSDNATFTKLNSNLITGAGRNGGPLDDIALNDSGQVAFLANLSDGGVGIYFYDKHLGLIKVIRTGDSLLGKPVKLLRFDAYPELGNEGRGLNNRGQVAFGFDDGSINSPDQSGYAIWTNNFNIGPIVGSVSQVVGNATVTHTNGTTSTLEPGDSIAIGDIIQTSAGSAVNITFSNGASWAISENTKMSVDKFVYQPADQSSTSFFQVLSGAFYYIDQLFGITNATANIETPVGAIGIRSTQFICQQDPCSSTQMVYLIQGELAITPLDTPGVTNICDAPVTIAMTPDSVTTNTLTQDMFNTVSNQVFQNTGIVTFPSWLEQYFGCTNNPDAAPTADPSGDGEDNYSKFLAGMNPTNPASYFHILSATPEGNNLLVSWMCGGGRTNVLQTTTDLSGGWTNASPDIVLAGSSDSVTNYLDVGAVTNTPARFYRVQLVQ